MIKNSWVKVSVFFLISCLFYGGHLAQAEENQEQVPLATSNGLPYMQVHDSTLYVGDTWAPEDNFDLAIDYWGTVLPFSEIHISGEVDTQTPGVYKVEYRYMVPNRAVRTLTEENVGTYAASATITVKERETARVKVQYINQSGQEVHQAQIIEGQLGETYDATTSDYQLTLDGYELDTTQLPMNAAGIFVATEQVVTYAYKEVVVLEAKPVIVQYLGQDGEMLRSSQVIFGSLGASYDARSDLYKVSIEGYRLDEMQLPTNAVGTFTEQEQLVTYIYHKLPAKEVSKDNHTATSIATVANKTEKQSIKPTVLPKTGSNQQQTVLFSVMGIFVLASCSGYLLKNYLTENE